MGAASQDIIHSVMAAFRLPRPCEWRLLPKSAVKRDGLVRVAFGEHPPVLARLHDPELYLRADIENQTLFRSFLHAGGIPVPKLYRDRRGRLFTDFRIDDETWLVTVEEWIAGEPPHAVTPSLITLLGSTLARMHLTAASCAVSFGHGTGMSLFSESDEYDRNAGRLRSSVERLGLESAGSAGLFAVWGLARERLSGLWPGLPRGPVHGDFAEYNVLLDETEDLKAVLDFNRAGDDVFVNEVVHACLRFPSFGDEGHDRANIARFMNAYESVRSLSETERLAIPYLIAVIRMFRSREVSQILEAAEKGETEKVLRHLDRLKRLAEPGRLLG